VLGRNEIHFHMVVHQPLKRQPPRLHAEPVSEILCDNDLPSGTYFIAQV
jgi:hypothetical protein